MPASMHILIGAGAAAAALAYLTVGPPLSAGSEEEVYDLSAGSIGRQFEIRSPGDAKPCLLSKRSSAEDAAHPVALHSACSDMAAELQGVTEWVDEQDGSVILMRADGSKAVEFGLSDGVSHESFAPSHLLLTMSERN